MENITQNKD